MHPSAREAMQYCIDTHLTPGQTYRVVDFGSRISNRQSATHRDLLSKHQIRYTGIDIREGRNVDKVMVKPYTIPLATDYADVVISGQVFEHVPFGWVSMMEIARVLKPGGLAFITAPSRGHEHDLVDCWRIYPDGMRSLAAYARLEVVETRTAFPPRHDGLRFDYAAIGKDEYWGDTLAVFRKPLDYPEREVRVIRLVTRWWANRVGGPQPEKVESIPIGLAAADLGVRAAMTSRALPARLRRRRRAG
jgi:SAM-dependent methyltransferase